MPKREPQTKCFGIVGWKNSGKTTLLEAPMHELQDAGQPKLPELIARLEPCDLVLVEGSSVTGTTRSKSSAF